jgi:GTP-binding protein
MLIDGTEHVSEPDKKLASYIAEQYKPVILVVNKWDLVLKDAREQAEQQKKEFDEELLATEYAEYLNQELKHLDFAPVIFVSAKEGLDVHQILDVAFDLFKQTNTRVSTSELNKVLQQIMEERAPSTPTGRRIKVYYVTQTDVAPPTIVMFVNHPEDVTESYQRFMINRFREMLPFNEIPFRLFVRGRAGAPSTADPFEAAQNRPGPRGAQPPRPRRAGPNKRASRAPHKRK